MADGIFAAMSKGWDYYDLLAWLCHQAAGLEEKEKRKLYKMVSSDLPRYKQQAERLFPQVDMRGKVPLPCYRDIDPELFRSLCAYMSTAGQEGPAVMIGLISCIDSMLCHTANLHIFLTGRQCPIVSDSRQTIYSQSFYRFDALNDKTKDRYGTLLPRVCCEWEKESARSRESVALDPLSFALKNHIWAPADPRWRIEHLYCDFRGTALERGLLEHEPRLKIVASPLARTAPFVAETDREKNCFYLQYDTRPDELLMERSRRIIDQAIEENADIVLFPEMMGTAAVLQFCEEHISESLSDHKPKLFLQPTREYEENGVWYNTLRMLDEDGECIFQYNKQHPFIFDKEFPSENGIVKEHFVEPILPDGRVCVIHVPGIGRIGVMICADVFQEDYLRRLVRDMKITLLLYPVFSGGRDLLVRGLAPAKEYMCDVLLCNTCAAWEDVTLPLEQRPENCGFDAGFINVYFPYGHSLKKSNFDGKTAVVSCADTDCRGCFFMVELAKKYTAQPYSPIQIRLEENV